MKKSLSARIPTSLFDRVSSYCDTHKLTQSHFLEKACEQFLSKNDETIKAWEQFFVRSNASSVDEHVASLRERLKVLKGGKI